MKKHVINFSPLLQGKNRKVTWAAMPCVLIFSLLFSAASCEKPIEKFTLKETKCKLARLRSL